VRKRFVNGNYQAETEREGFTERLKKVAVTAGKQLPSDSGFRIIFVVQGCGCGRAQNDADTKVTSLVDYLFLPR
jgi:hypothetical protein